MSIKDRLKNPLDAEGFKDVFGLESVSDDKAFTGGSSTGTKQVDALGTYMTEDDYNRLKNDDDVWAAYEMVNGASAMQKKRSKGPLSLNTLDALFDDLSAGKPKNNSDPEPTETVDEAEFYTDSEPVAKARAYVNAYEENILPYQGDYIMGTGRGRKADGSLANISDDFMEAYRLNLMDAGKPRNRDGSLFYEEDRQAAEMRGEQFRNQMNSNQYDPEEESRRVAGMY